MTTIEALAYAYPKNSTIQRALRKLRFEISGKEVTEMLEELKQKAEEYALKYINHKMAIHAIFELEVVQKDVTKLLVDFATEATKDLLEENKNLRDNYEQYKAMAEPTIKELKAYNEKLLNSDIEKHNKIVSLEAQTKELQEELEQAKKVQVVEHFEAYGQCRDSRRIAELENKNTELQEKNCRLEEQISKWKEDYICLENLKDNQIAELQAHNEKLTRHLEPQAMTALFEQVEEEIELEQKVKKLEAYNEKLLNGDIEKHNKIVSLEAQIEKMKCCHNCRKFHNLSYDCTCAEVCNEWELKEQV